MQSQIVNVRSHLLNYDRILECYYIIPNLSSTIHPLNNMPKTNLPWNWTIDCERAFRASKEQLSSYNPEMFVQ